MDAGPMASSSSPAILGLRPKALAENWDDDFDFIPTSKATLPDSTRHVSSGFGQPSAAGPSKSRRTSSPVEEDWDLHLDDVGPPEAKPVSTRASHATPSATITSSLTPSDTLTDSRPPLSYKHLPPSATQRDAALEPDTLDGNERGLPPTAWTRHEVADDLWKEEDGSNISGRARSRPLRPSKSIEQMPPPPLPGCTSSGTPRLPSRVNSQSTLRGEAGTQITDPAEPEKKRNLWKRLSGNPNGPSRPEGSRSPSHHRRRSSAFVGSLPSSGSNPPIPPLPVDIRSTSNTSTASVTSAQSQTSTASKSAEGPPRASMGPLSSMLRRSSSRLSQGTAGGPAAPPILAFNAPSSRPLESASRSSSASSYRLAPAIPPLAPSVSVDDPMPRLKPSASFSRGFHLPSPSPQSPYNTSNAYAPMQLELPPSMTRSPLMPEPEMPSLAEGEDGLTNRSSERRQKVRPVSFAASPDTHIRWQGQAEPSFEPGPSTPLSRRVSQKDLVNAQAASTPSHPSSPSMAKTSAFKRLASASKKHGRRISGKWGFGAGHATPSSEIRQSGPPTPTRLGADRPGPAAPLVSSEMPSVPPSLEALSLPNTEPHQISKAPPAELQSAMQSGSPGRSRHGRRRSRNDFIIPRDVLAKQKGLKQNIGAVKQFAAGVEKLKVLLEQHDRSLVLQPEASANTIALEREYAQYWEMAAVLVELASTGQDGTSHGARPPKSPVVPVLAPGVNVPDLGEAMQSKQLDRTDSPRPNADALTNGFARKGSGPDLVPALSARGNGLRTSSLPEPDRLRIESFDNASGGPPPADPGQWHASTGRHDLSKRQLEVLRSMLSSPILKDEPLAPTRYPQRQAQDGRSEPAQGEKTLSSTPSSNRLYKAAQSAPNTPSLPQTGIAVGRPPLPPTLQHDNLAKRRASRAGLAGLKDFIRGLKKGDGPGVARSQSSAELAVGGRKTGMPRSHSELGSGLLPVHRSDRLAQADKASTPLADKMRRPSVRDLFSAAQDDTSKAPGGSDLDSVDHRQVDALGRSRAGVAGLGLGWPEEPSTPTDPADHLIDEADEVVLALTPENLPVLLGYLQQCEAKLKEWETRAESS